MNSRLKFNKRFTIIRSFNSNRLEKEYLAKSYEIIAPINTIKISNNLNKSQYYENYENQQLKRG